MPKRKECRLSTRGMCSLNDYLLTLNISDKDLPRLFKDASNISEINKAKSDSHYEEFFKKHGICIKGEDDPISVIVKIFNEDSNVKALKHIVYNDGVISVNDLPETGNIYNESCFNFQSEAKKISKLKPQSKSDIASGDFELLLRMVLKEGTSPKSKGDVGILDTDFLEVKCHNRDGAHADGQLDVKSPIIICEEIDHLFGIDDNHCNYMLDKNICLFNNRMSAYLSSGGKKSSVAKALVDGVCKQYARKDDTGNYEAVQLPMLYKQAESLLKENMSARELADIVNCTQIYLYQLLEGFKYFILINGVTGDFFFIKDKRTFADYKKILSHIKFTSPYTTNKRDYTGKMSLR